ncbi:5'-3' exoribonuclease 1 [Pelomyxa schiedti]|nr:5'-3' exoribonuclease 1 [Pelomyxa schiedti]
MGVPKFFRWLVERYPLIMHGIPSSTARAPVEFDNLFIDLNGVLHTCFKKDMDDSQESVAASRSGEISGANSAADSGAPKNTASASATVCDERRTVLVMQYIEQLFRIAAPKRLLFIAVDGVAPRAKMNQQRARRFTSAKEAKKQASMLNKPISGFDSNCITPGTEFMVSLTSHLKFFIQKMQTEHHSWGKVKIIFSGQEVPGEGEHKIMDYIRQMKNTPDWDPNQSHCIYGLDADLFLLGLVTHEPHTSILREEVLLRDSRKQAKGQPQQFQLVHLSLLREYIDLEYRSLKLPFPYNLERIIDDFSLFVCFVGNDFLPNLPGIDIAVGTLDRLISIYKEVLPSLEGYIVDGASINKNRLAQFFEQVAQIEFEKLGDSFLGVGQLFEPDPPSPTSTEGVLLKGADKALTLSDSESERETIQNNPSPQEEAYFYTSPALHPTIFSPPLPEEESHLLDKHCKASYYRRFFDLAMTETEALLNIQHAYISGLFWVMQYYHTGCSSWSWFYPYHYSPLASDLCQLTTYNVSFEVGAPLLPLYQLLAVLPPDSCQLVPEGLRRLMIDPSSPIIDFYPKDFEVDMEEKFKDWEAVVLLPFIDEKRLLSAIQQKGGELSAIEKERNKYGETLIYSSSPSNRSFLKSTVPSLLSDIPWCTSQGHAFTLPHAPNARFSLHPLTKLGILAPPTVPTLHTLPIESAILRYVHVHLFLSGPSKHETLLLTLANHVHTTEEALSSLLRSGGVVFHSWPYLWEGKVGMLSDISGSVRLQSPQGASQPNLSQMPPSDQLAKIPHTQPGLEWWVKEIDWQRKEHRVKKGIEIGDHCVLVQVFPLESVAMGANNTPTPWYSETATLYPFHLLSCATDRGLTSVKLPAEKVVEEQFPIGSPLLYVDFKYPFAPGTVYLHQTNNRLQICITPLPPQPSLSHVISSEDKLWLPFADTASAINCSPTVLAKISANVFFDPGRRNLGLTMRRPSANLQLHSYCRKLGRGWEFSMEAVTALKEYKTRFPQVWDAVERDPERKRYHVLSLVGSAKPTPANDIALSVDWTIPRSSKPKDSPLSETDQSESELDIITSTPPHRTPEQGTSNDSVPLSSPVPASPKLNPQNSAPAEASPSTPPSSDTDIPSEMKPTNFSDNHEWLRKLEWKAKHLCDEITAWIQSQPLSGASLVPCGSDSAPAPSIKPIEQAGAAFAAALRASESRLLNLVPTHLCLQQAQNASFPVAMLGAGTAHPRPGSRVANLLDSHVPFGRTGTLVGVRGYVCDVILDEPVLTGTTLGGVCAPFRGYTVDSRHLLFLPSGKVSGTQQGIAAAINNILKWKTPSGMPTPGQHEGAAAYMHPHSDTDTDTDPGLS